MAEKANEHFWVNSRQTKEERREKYNTAIAFGFPIEKARRIRDYRMTKFNLILSKGITRDSMATTAGPGCC